MPDTAPAAPCLQRCQGLDSAQFIELLQEASADEGLLDLDGGLQEDMLPLKVGHMLEQGQPAVPGEPAVQQPGPYAVLMQHGAVLGQATVLTPRLVVVLLLD